MTAATAQNIRQLIDGLDFEAALAIMAKAENPTAEIDYLHGFGLLQVKRDLPPALQLLIRSEQAGFSPFWVKYMQAMCLNHLGALVASWSESSESNFVLSRCVEVG